MGTQKQELRQILRCPDCGSLRWMNHMFAIEGRELTVVECGGCLVTAYVLTNVAERDRRRPRAAPRVEVPGRIELPLERVADVPVSNPARHQSHQ